MRLLRTVHLVRPRRTSETVQRRFLHECAKIPCRQTKVSDTSCSEPKCSTTCWTKIDFRNEHRSHNCRDLNDWKFVTAWTVVDNGCCSNNCFEPQPFVVATTAPVATKSCQSDLICLTPHPVRPSRWWSSCSWNADKRFVEHFQSRSANNDRNNECIAFLAELFESAEMNRIDKTEIKKNVIKSWVSWSVVIAYSGFVANVAFDHKSVFLVSNVHRRLAHVTLNHFTVRCAGVRNFLFWIDRRSRCNMATCSFFWIKNRLH